MKKGKKTFEVALIFWFIYILLNTMLSGIFAYLLIKNYGLTRNIYGVIIMLVMFVALYITIQAVGINCIIHEIGHTVVYGILGQKATYHKISFYRWRTDIGKENETVKFNDELKEKNPTMFLILCLSGVASSTIISSMLSIIIIACAFASANLIKDMRFIGYISLICFSYNAILICEFISNLWNRKQSSDGFKARSLFKNNK